MKKLKRSIMWALMSLHVFTYADSRTTKDILSAASNGDTKAVALLIQEGADVNSRNRGRWGETALMLASKSGHTETVKLLIQNGAKVDTRNNHVWKSTALLVADSKKHTEAALLLILAGAESMDSGIQLSEETTIALKEMEEIAPNYSEGRYYDLLSWAKNKEYSHLADFISSKFSPTQEDLSTIQNYPTEEQLAFIGLRI